MAGSLHELRIPGYAQFMVGAILRDGSRVLLALNGGWVVQPDPMLRDLGALLLDPAVELLVIDANRYAPPIEGPSLHTILEAVADVAESAGVRVEYRL
jgi:hypothetical protein